MNHMPTKEIVPIFASTKLKLRKHEYMIVSLPIEYKERALDSFKNLSAFNSITIDTDEVSIILRSSDWRRLRKEFPLQISEGPYRIITFDIVLDLNLVGFLSVITALLADAGISVFAISTYLRDHILVKSGDVDGAMRLLNELIEKCKSTNL